MERRMFLETLTYASLGVLSEGSLAGIAQADIKLCLWHRGTADGKPARIFFSNVAVKLAGSDKWMDAQ